jgi:DNA-binding CsgD family transcriptional regulator
VKSTYVGPSPSFAIIDAQCSIRYVSAANGDLKLITSNSVELQPEVEAFIRALPFESEDWSTLRSTMLSDHRALRVVRVVGSEGTMFVLSIDNFLDDHRDCLERAARRHQLTRRETEVLSLILDGSSAGEIARMLTLSEHTVQGYFKRLLFKTGARNRVSMVAGIFDWDRIRTNWQQERSARFANDRGLSTTAQFS